MENVIKELSTRWLLKLPGGKNTLTLSDFRETGLPEIIIERLQIDLQLHLEEELKIPRSNWLDTEHAAVRKAWDDFRRSVLEYAQLPDSSKNELFQRVITDVVEQLAEPRKNIPRQLFESDRALTYEQLQHRSERIVIYRHLTAGLLRYMDRRNINIMPYEKAVDIFSQLDDKLSANFTPTSWSTVMAPWFELFGKRVPTEIVRRFFRDKKRSELADAFPDTLDGVNKTEIIERLSSPSLDVPYEAIPEVESISDGLNGHRSRLHPLENAGTYYEEFLRMREANRREWNKLSQENPPEIEIEPKLASIDTLEAEKAENTEISEEKVEEPSIIDESTAREEAEEAAEENTEDINALFTEEDAAEEVSPITGEESAEAINEQFEEESVKDDSVNISFQDIAEEGVLEEDIEALPQAVDEEVMNMDDERSLVEHAPAAELESVEESTAVSLPEESSTDEMVEDSNEEELDIDSMFPAPEAAPEEDTEAPAEAPEEDTEAPAEAPAADEAKEDSSEDDFDIDSMFPAPEAAPEEDTEAPAEAPAAQEAPEDGSEDDFDIDSMFPAPEAAPEKDTEAPAKAPAAQEAPEDSSEDDFDIDSMFPAPEAAAKEETKAPAKAPAADEAKEDSSEDDFDIDSLFAAEEPARKMPGTDALDKLVPEQGGDLADIFSAPDSNEEVWAEKVGLLEYLTDNHDYYIRELFEGEVEAFSRCVEDIDDFEHWKEASEYLHNDIFTAYGIDMISEPAIKFIDELQAYFAKKG